MPSVLALLFMQASIAPTPQTNTAAPQAKEKLVCKYLSTTGSRLEQKRVCGTKRQWEVTEQETQDAIRDRQHETMTDPQPTTRGGPR